MINIPIGSGDTCLQSSFDFDGTFNAIKGESESIVRNIIKTFEYIGAIKRGESASSLYCGAIPSFLPTEQLILCDIFETETIDIENKEFIAIQNYSRQLTDIILRVFYLPNHEIVDEHVKCLSTKTLNNEFLSVFIDKTLYETIENHYTEKYAIYSILKSYLQIKLSQYNLFVKFNGVYTELDILQLAGIHQFYKTLGEMYRDIVNEESDEDKLINTVCSAIDGRTQTDIMNRFIKESFEGKEFTYSRYREFISNNSQCLF